MKKILTILILSLISITANAAWTAAQVTACKNEVNRDWASYQFKLNGVQQVLSVEYQNAYAAALARCDQNVYITFQTYAWYLNSANAVQGVVYYHSLLKAPNGGTTFTAFRFSWLKPTTTSVLWRECASAATGLFFSTDTVGCNGYPLQYNYTSLLGQITGTYYSTLLGYGWPSTTVNTFPVYRCQSTIEHMWDTFAGKTVTYTSRWLSFGSTCNNGIHSTANAGVTNQGLVGYAYKPNPANYN